MSEQRRLTIADLPTSPRLTDVPAPRPPPRPQPQPQQPKHTPGMTLAGKAVKVVIPLDAAALARLRPPEGLPRIVLAVRVDTRVLTVDVAAKSLRKAIAVARHTGAENAVAFIQGKLVADTVTEAGIVAQPKVQKPEPVPA